MEWRTGSNEYRKPRIFKLRYKIFYAEIAYYVSVYYDISVKA